MITISRHRVGPLDCVFAVDQDHYEIVRDEGPDRVAIFCHGFGAGGSDLVGLAAEFGSQSQRLARTLYVFPAAPLELEPGYDSRAWWPIDMEKIQYLMMTGQTRELRSDQPERLSLCHQMVVEIIEQLREEFQLNASQVVVGGFSQGAMLTTDVALRYPETLGGLIVWSGSLINETEWRQAAANQAILNVFQSHGRQDPILPFAGAELLRDMLSDHGHQVRFVEFPGEHTIPAQAISGAVHLLESC